MGRLEGSENVGSLYGHCLLLMMLLFVFFLDGPKSLQIIVYSGQASQAGSSSQTFIASVQSFNSAVQETLVYFLCFSSHAFTD